jgi:putative ABC transport system permease protein
MRIPVLDGRVFDASDRPDSDPVAIVGRGFVERFFPDGDALGRTFRLGEGDAVSTLRIVGVAGDVRHDGVTEPPGLQVYIPQAQTPFRRRFVVARATGDAAAVAPALRGAVAELDPHLPAAIRPMTALVDESLVALTLMGTMLGGFGVFALVLAAIGIYGLIAYSVAQRGPEIGVRMALGADTRQIGRLVAGEGLRLTLIGIAIGMLGALAAGRLLASLLFGVAPADPVTLVVAAAAFLGTAFLASAVPARRATRTDPMRALRAD